MKFDDLNENPKHLGLRIAAFVLVLVIAVGAFGFGVASIGRREEGYALVETNQDETAPRYANGLSFRYYYTGSSAEIREASKQLKEDYSAVLNRVWKLLDPDNEYEGFQNLATLNLHPGEEITVNEELFAILTDAWEKTQEHAGFNLFAGPLYREWEHIRVLDDPVPFDPAVSPESADRLAVLAELAADPENYRFEVVDEAARTVRVTVSQRYRDYLRAYEVEAPILDLNELRDAYLVQAVAAVLEEKGWNNGYLTTDSGLTLSLSGHSAGEFCFYAQQDGQVTAVGGTDVTAGSACSQRKTFAYAEGEVGYYVLPDGTERHPNPDAATGDYANLVRSCYAVSRTGDCVAACYRSLQLMNVRSVEAAAEMMPDEVFFTTDKNNILYVSAAGSRTVRLAEASGFRIVPLS